MVWSSRPTSRRACWHGIWRARPPPINGSVVATNLKVSGVSVFSAGDFMGAEGSEVIVLSDVSHGTYKKLVVSGGRLTGAVLVGDVAGRAVVSRIDQGSQTDRGNSRAA